MSESTTLVEQSADWRSEARVDRAARLVRNVALAGPASRNGYRYAESALRDGAVLYERKPVFLDHAADPRRPQERTRVTSSGQSYGRGTRGVASGGTSRVWTPKRGRRSCRWWNRMRRAWECHTSCWRSAAETGLSWNGFTT
jgi:hypothetical protein